MKLTQKVALRLLQVKFRALSLLSAKLAAKKALDLFRTPRREPEPARPKIFSETENLEIELDGIPLRGFRWNHPSEKKLLIVHGFESSVMNFGHFIAPLVAKGYEVLAFDAPGHGISAGDTITAPLFAKMIETIDRRYGPIRAYIAHSFGGLALALALEKIPHDESYKVVLIAPLTETGTAALQFFELLRLSPKVCKEFDSEIERLGGHPLEWYSIRRAVNNIKARILWLHDEDDEQTPLSDAWIVKGENHPNIEFIITRGLGHRKIYRAPETVSAVTRFL